MFVHREKVDLSKLPHTYDGEVTLAVIGGTGLYDLPNLKPIARLTVSTPWGFPSGPITISQTDSGFPVAFLARHGQHHDLLPSDVPSRANIAALKKLGVKAIIAFSAVGSLQPEIKPRDFVLPTQIIDRTKGIRPSTFFEKGFVAHAMFGEPFDLKLNELIANAIPSSGFLEGENDAKPTLHTKKHTNDNEDLTIICMEGPQFSTRAESKLYRSWGGSIINMSVLPEAKLAREAEIAYQMICMSTDYDSWNESEEPVTVETVVGNLKANSANACKLAAKLIDEFAEKGQGIGDDIKGSMKFAVSTSPHGVKKELLEKMHYLFPGYWEV
ncbi:S-methyl-5-thioadenosine phosphorylase [Lodderomyces elongisporus]|uniref:S-methyl-5'-thioadenosine phosphorylase n=1 Tax=Lodderomyces elongisporus (strain ATCC 11503 / CBS 2605 / JCM 1781 / NBRC 1676 / NRRL YB-4239) TaxID=379508 RepID=A5DY08_LODEL|nr:S-methyl-5-thioadenosine phosphorylase [Lodderomyces elongisporus]EDK44066.1 multicopy enhancer of UAS2 [Lodderomyces elongisporus NRRL YB-4239]WLF78525.1 S-methyl-5-thioadenosine phosphorylase [Lodderomyces elongisporus]